MSARFFAVDTETTGLDPNKDQIISIAWLLCDNQLNELSRKCIYAQPTVEVAKEAAAVNGYSYEAWQSKGAVTQDVMFAEVRSTLKLYNDLIPLGHNVKFDTDFMRALFREHKAFTDYKRALSYHVYDTVVATMFFDMVKFGRIGAGYRLTDLDERFNLGLRDNAHEAMADITATLDLAKLLITGLNGKDLAPPRVKHSSMFSKTGSDSAWTMSRGKHKGKTVLDLYNEKPDYIVWMIENIDDLSEEQLTYLKSFTQ